MNGWTPNTFSLERERLKFNAKVAQEKLEREKTEIAQIQTAVQKSDEACKKMIEQYFVKTGRVLTAETFSTETHGRLCGYTLLPEGKLLSKDGMEYIESTYKGSIGVIRSYSSDNVGRGRSGQYYDGIYIIK